MILCFEESDRLRRFILNDWRLGNGRSHNVKITELTESVDPIFLRQKIKSGTMAETKPKNKKRRLFKSRLNYLILLVELRGLEPLAS